MTRHLLPMVLLASACRTVEVPPPAALPELETQDLQVTEQDLQSFTLRLTATLKGEGSITSAQWELVVDGNVVDKGVQSMAARTADGRPVPPHVAVRHQYVNDAESLKAMAARVGTMLVALRGAFTVQTATGTAQVPFARSKELRTPKLPHMKAPDFEAGRYSEDEAGVLFHLGVDNPNPFEVVIQSLSYEVSLAGKKVSDGDVGKSERIRPSSTGVFDLEGKLSGETHTPADVKKLIKARQIPYEISGELKAGLFTESYKFSGTISLPPAR